MSSGVGYLANSAGVVWFTRRSVVCADRTVAISSWKGFSKSSSGWAYGYTSASSRLIRRARRTSATGGACSLTAESAAAATRSVALAVRFFCTSAYLTPGQPKPRHRHPRSILFPATGSDAQSDPRGSLGART